LDFLCIENKHTQAHRLTGLYLYRNTQKAMEEILDINIDKDQKKIIDDIKLMLNDGREPEEFYDENYNEFSEYIKLVTICLEYQQYDGFDLKILINIIMALIKTCKNSKKFFYPWLKARAKILLYRESLFENKEKQKRIINCYKRAFNEGSAYAGGFLGQFLLEAITINRLFDPRREKNVNGLYDYANALELFSSDKQGLLDIINKKNTIQMRFISIQYSNFSPRGKMFDEYYHAIETEDDLKKLFEEAIKINNEGLEFDNTKCYEQAEHCFSRASVYNPVYVNVYSNRGNLYIKLGITDAALIDFNTALMLDPNHEKTLYNRGLLLMQKNQFKNALNDFSVIINSNPEDCEVYLMRGICQMKIMNLIAAISDYTKAIELNPKYAEAYFYRGIIYAFMDNKENAQKDHYRAVQIDPNKFNNKNMTLF